MSSIPHEELPILEALINIRNRQTALKKDSSEFIRSQDVSQLYQQVIKQVTKLNAVRDEQQAIAQDASTASSTSDHAEQADPSTANASDDSPVLQQNRVDTHPQRRLLAAQSLLPHHRFAVARVQPPSPSLAV